ncbi:glycoside hydrolase family 3 protein [Exidia glandulosa HHB12029]|uniref:beta-glucosidase n=1 Tax=Exidia glandulosa HHB12029 TaxID=1314781 RepID=A0A165ZFT1_EXIGL|nr:glycoside hydrolase family 3 protein [Exidia glandulosa HHB12029]
MSAFANADIDAVIEQLTHEEAVSLIAGVGFWHTAAIPRLGVPQIKVSDGPNGVRGERFFMGTPAKSVPCATALAATWNPALIHDVGARILAVEARLRSASAILGPTVNIQRSPLGGRSFESFAEDPHLSGTICAAYIKGVQSQGIACTIKHFVCNDQENDRMGYNVIVTPRALREVYLMPFMIAQRDAQPWAYMTAYNRINGVHGSEHKELITGILRGEWGHDGMVMSDWFGTYSIDEAVKAGLDLEMPGERKLRTQNNIERVVTAHKLAPSDIKARAREVLKFVQKCAKGAGDILDGDGSERSHDTPEEIALLRHVAASSIVLLRNKGGVLPLDKSKLKKVALIGPNMKERIINGGGSSSLRSTYVVSPYEGIVNALGNDVEVIYAEGARSFKSLPSLDFELTTPSGERGWRLSWHNHSARDPMTPIPEAVREMDVDETYASLSDAKTDGLTERWSIRFRGFLVPRPVDCEFEFGLTVAGRGKLYVDGQLVIDNWTRQRRGTSFFNRGTEEERGRVQLKKGIKHEVVVEFMNVKGPADGDEDEIVMTDGAAVRLGGAVVVDEEREMEIAEQAARDADVAIVVVGLNSDWETEGEDRTTLALPARTDELVRRVLAANARTVVINQSGSAVEMPWADDVSALLQTWYLGNSAGDAMADVLFGKVNPSARLSLTFPRRLQDTPSYNQFGSYGGTVMYGEDLFVGYKHYIDRVLPAHFPFGFGLSYTDFAYADLAISSSTIKSNSAADVQVQVSVKVSNTGSRTGSEVVQIYVAPPLHPLGEPQPSRSLRAFTRIEDLAPGTSQMATLTLDKYAFSAWEPQRNAWIIRKGTYGVFVAKDAEEIVLRADVTIGSDIFWNGL